MINIANVSNVLLYSSVGVALYEVSTAVFFRVLDSWFGSASFMARYDCLNKLLATFKKQKKNMLLALI